MNKPNEYSAVEADNKQLREREEEESKKKHDYWRCSSMGQCYRKRFWDRAGEFKEPYDIHTLKIFDEGHKAHEYWQSKLKKQGILISAEEEFTDKELNLKGHCDAIVKVNGEYILYDIKTVHPFKFNHLKRGEADRQYIMQLMAYVYMARKKYKGLKEARLLYHAKDPHGYRNMEKVYFINDRIIEEIRQEIDCLNNYWESGLVPPAEPSMSFECGYCRHSQCESYKPKNK